MTILHGVLYLARNVFRGEERGETDLFAGYTMLNKKFTEAIYELKTYQFKKPIQGFNFTSCLFLSATGAFSEDVMRTMVLVLNHLFARRFLHANFVRTTKKCPSSKVSFLFPLPILNRYFSQDSTEKKIFPLNHMVKKKWDRSINYCDNEPTLLGRRQEVIGSWRRPMWMDGIICNFCVLYPCLRLF